MKCINRVFSMMPVLALSASMAVAATPPGVTSADCKSVFPNANSAEATRTLASGVQYTEAWEHGSWGPAEEFLGYVFQKSVSYQGQTVEVMAGVTSTGVISEVSVKGVAGVEQQFLEQFRGQSVRNDFDLARTPEDLLFVPAKIKGMKSNMELATGIAQGVKEIALSAAQVLE